MHKFKNSENILGLYFIYGIISEILYLLIFIFTIPLGYVFTLTGVNKNATRKSPVVLINGFLNQNLLYYFLKRHLEKEGYKVYMANLGLFNTDIKRRAKLLSEYIDKNRLWRITLIGASMGGLIGFHYLQELNGWTRTNKFIAIGTPFKGSYLKMPNFFKYTRQLNQYINQYIKSLFDENKKIKNLKKIICLYSNFDEFVPGKNSVIPGSVNKKLNVIGHANLLAFSLQTFKAVAEHAGQ